MPIAELTRMAIQSWITFVGFGMLTYKYYLGDVPMEAYLAMVAGGGIIQAFTSRTPVGIPPAK